MREVKTMSKMMVKQAQHRMFAELVEDLETRTPETVGLGWKGWRLIHASTAKQDPFREGGRRDNGKWRPVTVTGAKRRR
jgi:hypothetical protein